MPLRSWLCSWNFYCGIACLTEDATCNISILQIKNKDSISVDKDFNFFERFFIPLSGRHSGLDLCIYFQRSAQGIKVNIIFISLLLMKIIGMKSVSSPTLLKFCNQILVFNWLTMLELTAYPHRFSPPKFSLIYNCVQAI